MDGRSRPFFCGVDETLNSQQKEALTRGIQQVVSTMPSSFECFEFQFSGHQIYIYKLDHDMILLVLATSSLVQASYFASIEPLKRELQKDIANTIATFRLLAGSPTFTHQTTRPTQRSNQNGQPPAANSAPTQSRKDRMPASSSAEPAVVTVPDITLQDAIAALNQLSQFTVQYLGGNVVTNYWKTTRPAVPWLQQFQVERSALIRFAAAESAFENVLLTLQQQQWLQDWVEAFIQRCSKVMRDFPRTVRQQALSDRQQFLLRSKLA